MSKAARALTLAALVCVLIVGVAWAETPTFKLTIKNHRFEPAQLEVPAGQMIKLVIHNADGSFTREVRVMVEG